MSICRTPGSNLYAHADQDRCRIDEQAVAVERVSPGVDLVDDDERQAAAVRGVDRPVGDVLDVG
jgi:hypothetical protein